MIQNDKMPRLPDSDRCCGCTACYAVCPVRAISMRPDAEGFLQPVVAESVCIKCGRCEKVCPVLNPGAPRTPLAVYAAKAKDDGLRRISSSGGIFSLLARKVFEDGGVVYGAAFEDGTHKVVHKRVVDEAGLDDLRGSKYVQSELGDTFHRIREDLKEGRKVLFSGCPCQVAGFRGYLGKEYDNLLLVDVVCHAVPSPVAWQRYLSCQEHKEDAKIVRVFSRRNCSWRNHSLSFEATNESCDVRIIDPASRTYLKSFIAGLFNRNGCSCCASRGFRSGADITLGDFWRVERKHLQINDDIGVSAVMCNTPRGICSFSRVQPDTVSLQSTLRNVVSGNKSLYDSHKSHKNRMRFFAEINDTNFDSLVDELLMPPWWYRALRWAKQRIFGNRQEA